MAESPGPSCIVSGASTPALAPFVSCFWSYEGYAAPHARERLLPTGNMGLFFTLDSEGRVAAGVSGAYSEAVMLDTSRPFSIIGVEFKAGGGFPFFGGPSDELHNCSASLDEVWGAAGASLRDRLWDATTPQQRFRIVQQALLASRRDRLAPHRAVRYALAAFATTPGAGRVDEVAAGIGISARRFTDVFRSEVGLSPKAFCRIRRFNEVLTRIERRSEVDWADVALSCGYFDQAHFNHDFRAFSGLSPSDYLRNRISRLHVVAADR
jgi:AraC-like DNA-binding protein